jgi:hypothetical protein
VFDIVGKFHGDLTFVSKGGAYLCVGPMGLNSPVRAS